MSLVCHECGQSLGLRYRAIDYRRAVLQGQVFTVMSSDVYPVCCSSGCWEAHWPGWAGMLGLIHVYPDTSGHSAPCGFCGESK